MRTYQRIDGRWHIVELAPRVKTRADIIQEWVEADILPLLTVPGTTAMEETLKEYLSVSDERIEQAKAEYIKFKKGKPQKPKRLVDIPVPRDLSRKQYVSPAGYRLGDTVRLKNGQTMTLDRVNKKGEFESPGGFGSPGKLTSEDDILEVIQPAPLLQHGQWISFVDPFEKQQTAAYIEGFVRNSADVFVRISRNGRKIPITVNARNLDKITKERTTA